MSDHRDFAEFYAASFHRLTAQLFLYTGQLADAQDVVQEAMIRALARWPTISGYDDPLSWVRKVAWNLATSRWRRWRRSIDVMSRLSTPDTVPGPDPNRIAIAAALAHLPPVQRQAVILHYLVDLPVSEIAEITGAAEGTVKSWLHRARAVLATRLDESVVEVTNG